MIGHAHAAGLKDGARPDLGTLADYFSLPQDRLGRAMCLIESADRPEILLLQRPHSEAEVGAAAFFASVWSRSYAKFGNPYGKVHRDFHYQVMFCALAALVEAGCDRLRIEHPMPGTPWRRDAYVCLLEATMNLRRDMNPKIAVHLQEGTYDPRMPENVDSDLDKHALQDHRPVGVSPHIFEGLNMRTVFVERARDAIRAARGLAPTEAEK